jgi:nucleoside-diphosphate-sugar epimerase
MFDFLAADKPDAVITAATKVDGIHANNTYPLKFLTENLLIETSLIDVAHAAGIEKLLLLVYSKIFRQPILCLLMVHYDQSL